MIPKKVGSVTITVTDNRKVIKFTKDIQAVKLQTLPY
jgi:hypothetical protein